MTQKRSLGREFGWLWTAYAVSRFGTALAFNAFGLVAILVLHAGPAEVSLLSAAGLAVGALVAIPLGPWVEFRRKRPVLIAMDLIRFAALLSVPIAYAFGALGFVQLLTVTIIAATADIGFTAASGAYLKTLVPPRDLLVANARFESTNWTAIVLGPPLGGAAIGLFGPMITLLADAVSYLASAAGLRAIDDREPKPVRADSVRTGGQLEGWRYILGHPGLWPLLVNDAAVSALIMATQPLMSVLMLTELGFAPWEFGLAFALPCLGGLAGARLAPGLVDSFGHGRILRVFGTLRVCWPVALGAVTAGAGGLTLVLVVQTAVIICMAVFNPVFATYRLEQLPADRATRALAAWSISKKVTVAVITGLWGLLAAWIGARAAIILAGVLLLATPVLFCAAHGGVGRGPSRRSAREIHPARSSGAQRGGQRRVHRRRQREQRFNQQFDQLVSGDRFAAQPRQRGLLGERHPAPDHENQAGLLAFLGGQRHLGEDDVDDRAPGLLHHPHQFRTGAGGPPQQGQVRSAVFADIVDIAADRVAQHIEQAERGVGDDPGQQFGVRVPDDFELEVLFGGEIVEQQASRDPRLGRDLADRDVLDRAFTEHLDAEGYQLCLPLVRAQSDAFGGCFRARTHLAILLNAVQYC